MRHIVINYPIILLLRFSDASTSGVNRPDKNHYLRPEVACSDAATDAATQQSFSSVILNSPYRDVCDADEDEDNFCQLDSFTVICED